MSEEQKIQVIPLHYIVALPYNVCRIEREIDLMLREDMSRIESKGINKIDPILLRRLTLEETEEYKKKGNPVAQYQIVDGHSRWQDARELGWNNIRAIVTDMTLDEAREFNYKKNKVRGTVDPMREAAYFTDLNRTTTIEKIAEKFGMSEKEVDRILRRLKVTDETRQFLRQHRDTGVPMDATHYEILGSVKEPDKQKKLAELMVTEKLTKRESEIAKTSVEEGIPKEQTIKIVKATQREKLEPKEVKALVEKVKEKPEEVERLTSLPKEELMAEVTGAKIVRTPEEVEEVFKKVPTVSLTETFTCPCGCGYKLQVDWVERKGEWSKPTD